MLRCHVRLEVPPPAAAGAAAGGSDISGGVGDALTVWTEVDAPDASRPNLCGLLIDVIT
jgi:hypothetical protein